MKIGFKQHVCGGMIAGALFSGAIFVSVRSNYIMEIVSPKEYLMFFGVITFFSMFPDLDVASIPQRWFYRFLIIGCLYMCHLGMYKEVSVVSILCMTPLIHKHRGWTHNPISAVLGPIIFLTIYFVFIQNIKPDIDMLIYLYKTYYLLLSASTFGWLTHLFLDTKLVGTN